MVERIDPTPTPEYDAKSDPLMMVCPRELAKLIGISVRTLQIWRRAGRVPAPDLSMGERTKRWRRSTIIRWLDQHGGRGAR